MRKGHYRYIRKSSLGAYNFGKVNTCSSEIKKSNAQYKIMVSITNQTPQILPRSKAIALIDELEKINNIDWKYYGSPSTYTRDKICYKINTGVYDELLAEENTFNDWEKLAYNLYKPEESEIISSTESWDATENIINGIRRKGKLGDINEVKLLMCRVDDKIEYYKEKHNSARSILILFGLGLGSVILYYALNSLLH